MLTFFDSNGFIVGEEGITAEKLAFMMNLKNNKRGRIKKYKNRYPNTHYEDFDPKKNYNPLW